MGKFKLIKCMKEQMFSPYLRKICTDVAVTCEECQKGKYQRVHASPPVLMLSMKEPFELVAIDCVTLPITARGNVGTVVMVDHKSKFVTCAAVKNKTSENVARVVSMVLLPVCVRKPVRMLSDNGLEFIGRPLEQMLREWGIEHVVTTPYMLSVIGLAERTRMILSEMLRMLTDRENASDLLLGRLVAMYNGSVHKSTGMLSSECVMNYVRARLDLNEEEQDVWRQANERCESFRVGDKVLKEAAEKGRLSV
ncbi:uncharacterized protein [Macrobrachium rosenbergii]|uniref:uncharacterized protein n=1 Tax=Macrobrachium rosenbergii TaxID=79674 RepID=UPI0034D6569D